MNCYRASFNVGKAEVWSTGLYFSKNPVFSEIEGSKEEIFERIDCFSVFITEDGFNRVWDAIVSDIKNYGMYEDKMNRFDFFVLEEQVQEKFEHCNVE